MIVGLLVLAALAWGLFTLDWDLFDFAEFGLVVTEIARVFVLAVLGAAAVSSLFWVPYVLGLYDADVVEVCR